MNENTNEILKEEALVEFESENFEDCEPETEEESGISTLVAMGIGAGITAAAFAVVGLAKKGFKKLKAKKEAAAKDDEPEEPENDCDDSEDSDVEDK